MTTSSVKPFSQACANNAQPILERLSVLFSNAHSVLEIGSGTGQHAFYFSRALPHINWQASDLPENIAGIEQWRAEAGRCNFLPTVALDVSQFNQVTKKYDAVFMANTLHIMPMFTVAKAIVYSSQSLRSHGLLVVYGPFNYDGNYTSDSNSRFDQWLKAADGERGIRDFEKINVLAEQVGFKLQGDYEMPANNRLLVWCLKG